MSQQPLFGQTKDPREPLKVPGENQSPDTRTVEKFHRHADTDARREAIHHRIGTGTNQSASGSHRHDGSDSGLILEGTTLIGTRGTATAVGSIIAALVKLGASDNTTA